MEQFWGGNGAVWSRNGAEWSAPRPLIRFSPASSPRAACADWVRHRKGERGIRARGVCRRGFAGRLVDLGGFEPPTSSMPLRRAPNCATGPRSRAKALAARNATAYHNAGGRGVATPALAELERAADGVGYVGLEFVRRFALRDAAWRAFNRLLPQQPSEFVRMAIDAENRHLPRKRSPQLSG